ncbi:acyl carrier protein [Candidatus Methylomirabilis limnetica]|jgi:acyl carrier protein|uniref:Acyl carrier protein n=1 Tax=Candidatus Methylomirabilis limnetica TaxID=2033718 RepID=A0A2T4TYI6_9BACT|nr:phosphopantetheine-binding protein [Candidatus Methylomirabilis limnetica]PTL36184.1 acyl carrier protein [Candidatus Methylomirabilis limnetica]
MTHYETILPQLYEILQPYGQVGQILSGETELVADLNLDSLKVMELLLELEERFDISIPLNIVSDVRTIGDFARQIEQLMEHR